MAQELLDRTQVGAGPQQMGGEAVAQGVGRGAGGQAEPPAQPLHQGLGAARRIGAAPAGAEQRLVRFQRERQDLRIGVDGRGHLRQHRRDTRLGPLAEHPER